MNINFIGINDKIINLDGIVLIEDVTEETGPTIIILTTLMGATIELTGDDADALIARAEVMMDATDAVLAKVQQVVETAEVGQ